MAAKPIVIYHGNCQDGFTAAWAIWKVHPDWEFYPAKHGDPPPDVTGRVVYMVDFSYKKDVLLKMADAVRCIVILDHHKTAQEDLDAIDRISPNIDVCFDMEKSGARLAWEYFHPTEPIPALVAYVEDRDLWRFAVHGTKETTAYLFSQPYDFHIWDSVDVALNASCYAFMRGGGSILDAKAKDTLELSKTAFRTVIAGYDVPVVNVPYIFSSDMGQLLDKGEPFAASYYYDGPSKKLVFSLRSDDNGVDVSEIAKKFGGGGHKHAAGFGVPYGAIPHLEGVLKYCLESKETNEF